MVFLDEILFTKRAIKQREWSARNTNLSADQVELYVGYRAALVSMTAEKGIQVVHIYDRAITEPEFAYHLRKLREIAGDKPLALFMDNLHCHKNKEARELLAELDIRPIYNVGYSPEFNPIEAVFSKVKRQFKDQRLHNLVTKIGFDMEDEIRKAFTGITPAHCAACTRKSRHLLERAT